MLINVVCFYWLCATVRELPTRLSLLCHYSRKSFPHFSQQKSPPMHNFATIVL